jgi:hypothetical protein
VQAKAWLVTDSAVCLWNGSVFYFSIFTRLRALGLYAVESLQGISVISRYDVIVDFLSGLSLLSIVSGYSDAVVIHKSESC